MIKKYILFSLFALTSFQALAENTDITTIKWMKSLPDYNGVSNILIHVDSLGSLFSGDECSRGLWFDTASPGANFTSSMLLSAYHSKTKLIVSVDKTTKWPGSGDTKFCKITAVTFGDVSWY